MLTNKDIKKLKAIANTSTHKYQVGKSGIDKNVTDLLNNALKAHELIKVYFNKSIVVDIKKFTKDIVKNTNSELVGQIGHMIIIYRPNPDKKNHIVL